MPVTTFDFDGLPIEAPARPARPMLEPPTIDARANDVGAYRGGPAAPPAPVPEALADVQPADGSMLKALLTKGDPYVMALLAAAGVLRPTPAETGEYNPYDRIPASAPGIGSDARFPTAPTMAEQYANQMPWRGPVGESYPTPPVRPAAIDPRAVARMPTHLDAPAVPMPPRRPADLGDASAAPADLGGYYQGHGRERPTWTPYTDPNDPRRFQGEPDVAF